MATAVHFTKPYFKACDKDTPYFRSVIDENLLTTKIVLDEFYKYLSDNSITQEAAISSIRSAGGIVTRNGLWNYRRGYYYTCSNTFLNIISRFCGYKNYVELLYAVRDRAASGSAG